MENKRTKKPAGAPEKDIEQEVLISGLKRRIRELEKKLSELKRVEADLRKEEENLRDKILELTTSINLKTKRLTGTIRDITESTRTENALRVSEARLRRAELASKSGNWELHIESGIMIGSEGAQKLYGVYNWANDYSIIKQIPLPEYRKKMDEALRELIEHNKPYNIEFKIKNHTTGEIIDIHSISEYDRENKILFGSIQDVTAYKKIEEKLQNESSNLIIAKDKAEESDRLKTAFLHNISHEIRTPLNAIIGFSGFLDQTDLSPEDRKSYIDIIFQSNNQLLSIINDILNISHIETGQVVLKESWTNLSQIIRNLYNQFYTEAEKKNLSLLLNTDDSLNDKMIMADESKLIQVITNLLNNAFKFTDHGYVEMGYKVNGDHIEFFVKDTGIGIPEGEHDRIFERFYQVDKKVLRLYSGTGLGLSISNAYVELMGGKFKLISEPGKGSIFSFTIPYKEASLKPTIENDAIQIKIPEEKAMRTILIAEDEESNFELIKAMLRSCNYNFIRAVNGEEAVEICKSDPGIDMILMDIKMPLTDGFEATSRILTIRPEMPIIAQTAYAHAADRANALQCGCVDYIAKPFERKLLLSLIEKYIK